MQPLFTFEVVPSLPPRLACLKALAYNLRWTWDHETISLFCRLDRDLWEKCSHNPVLMLGTISQERLSEAAVDDGFLSQLDRVWNNFQAYINAEHTWYKKRHSTKHDIGTIAYFSAEFGITECLPIYSGGLGILAGDHVKAASDMDLPFVAVGLLYQQGYFRQYLNADGWQQQTYPVNDFYTMPIHPVRRENGDDLVISVDLPGRKVYIRAWKAQVGRVPLYLLDTNIPENSKPDEDITDALYHADKDIRIRQEIVLGIGGMRLLKELGIDPSVCHMNEGHSAFLALERIYQLMNEHSISFAEAKEISAAGLLFTTHTAVPAGLDKFAPDLVERYFSDYYRKLGLSNYDFFALGRSNPNDNNEAFSMATLAIKLSSKTNAVSKLHGVVSQKLFNDIWKGISYDEVPISYITNGIHTRSWISEQMADLYDRYLGPKWSEEIEDQKIWRKIADIPDEELWRIHERRREKLVWFSRARVRQQLEKKGALPSELKAALEILHPQALTIGFARRFATYKRANLLMRDPQRLASILTNKERPVQIIFAGKAHPEDAPAKELIREIVHFCRNEDVAKHIIFLEDYDMNVARYLVEGVDVWLNTPRRFLEACGTSGMKVSFNGGINFSILDGWWDEIFKPTAGWAIGHGEVYSDTEYQDTVESNALYDILEKEIAPLFYSRNRENIPKEWLARMKSSMLDICPNMNINRMVREYATRMYFPASERYHEFLGDNANKAKELAVWKDKISNQWSQVSIEQVDAAISDQVQVGDDMRVRAKVHLGQLSPNDVSVQIFHGRTDAYGNIEEGKIIPMTVSTGEQNGSTVFTGTIRYFRSGRHGFTVRVLPSHEDLSSQLETGMIQWANRQK